MAIQFNLHSQAWVDVIQFRHLLTVCEQSHPPDRRVCPECVEQVRAAVIHNHGDLLVGVSLPGCQEFEWWLTCKQEEYHQLMIETLKGLVNYFNQEYDYPHALQYTQQAIELEPWNEAFHRQKMSLLAASGQRGAALRQVETCRLILAKELDLEPESETTRLFQLIREGLSPT